MRYPHELNRIRPDSRTAIIDDRDALIQHPLWDATPADPVIFTANQLFDSPEVIELGMFDIGRACAKLDSGAWKLSVPWDNDPQGFATAYKNKVLDNPTFKASSEILDKAVARDQELRQMLPTDRDIVLDRFAGTIENSPAAKHEAEQTFNLSMQNVFDGMTDRLYEEHHFSPQYGEERLRAAIATLPQTNSRSELYEYCDERLQETLSYWSYVDNEKMIYQTLCDDVYLRKSIDKAYSFVCAHSTGLAELEYTNDRAFEVIDILNEPIAIEDLHGTVYYAGMGDSKKIHDIIDYNADPNIHPATETAQLIREDKRLDALVEGITETDFDTYGIER